MAVEPGKKARGLAVLLATQDMKQVFEAWPLRMNLAVCLREDGSCQMLVFRDEEGMRILPRIRRAMGLATTEISVFPKIHGVQTRKLMYSEEKQLLSLVRNAPEIIEEAADYSINYTYAVEEGLDPVLFIHSARKKSASQNRANIPNRLKRHDERPLAPVKNQAPGHIQSSAKPRITNDLPKFLQKGSNISMGTRTSEVKCARTTKIGRIGNIEQGWIKIDMPGSTGGQMKLNSLGRVFLRDDQRVIAIQRDKDDVASADMPEKILVYVGDRQSPLSDALCQNVGLAQVTFENGFLFIDLKYVRDDQANFHQSAEATPPTVPYAKFLMSAGMAMIGFVFALQSFFQPNGSNLSDQTIDWSQFKTEETGSEGGLQMGTLGNRTSPSGS